MQTVAPELPVENDISIQIIKRAAGTSHKGTSLDIKLAKYFLVTSHDIP